MVRSIVIAALAFVAVYLVLRGLNPIPPHEDPTWVRQSDVGWSDPWERGRLAFADASNLPRADVLVVGDSRAAEGLRVRVLFPTAERPFILAGIGDCGRLSTLEEILAANRVTARTLVVSITPHLLGPDRPCPRVNAKNPYRLSNQVSALRRLERVARRGSTSWFRPTTGEVAVRALFNRPRFSDRAYRWLTERPWPFDAQLTRTIQVLTAYRSAGRAVWVVRLPIDAGLRAIEDRAIAPEHLVDAFEAARLPYLDLGVTDETYDGSHLPWRAADRVSAQIAAWMAGYVSPLD